MRRPLAALIAFVMSLTLVACGSSTTNEKDNSASKDSSKKLVKIGAVTLISHPSLDLIWQGIQDGLADAGYSEGDNLEIDFKNAQGDQQTIPNIASTFADSDYDLFVAIATPPAQAVAQAIQDRPILFASVTDPVAAGLVNSLENPGGNVTGTSDQLPTDRQLEVIQKIDPQIKSVGIVYNSGEVNAEVQARKAIEAGKQLGLDIQTATVMNSSEVQQAAESLTVDAYFVLVDNMVVSALESMIQVAEQNQRLLVTSDVDSVERGAAASLSTDYYAQGLQTADMIVRVINGEDPATMPVELQESLEFVVNPEAAKRMGTTIPDDVINEADEVL